LAQLSSEIGLGVPLRRLQQDSDAGNGVEHGRRHPAVQHPEPGIAEHEVLLIEGDLCAPAYDPELETKRAAKRDLLLEDGAQRFLEVGSVEHRLHCPSHPRRHTPKRSAERVSGPGQRRVWSWIPAVASLRRNDVGGVVTWPARPRSSRTYRP